MTYVLSEGKGYFTASIEDIMHETGEWDLKRWHEELEQCADCEVLRMYRRLAGYSPYIYITEEQNKEAGDIYNRAMHSMELHIREQMNPQNWGSKWWMQ